MKNHNKRADTPYGPLEYFPQDDPIGRALGAYGIWAGPELRLLNALLCPGGVVVDVGANIGTHTLAFARRVGPTGHVVAYEPQPCLLDVLRRNLEANEIVHVEVMGAALGGETGEAIFDEVDYNAHVNIGGVSMSRATEGTVGRRVRMETLDARDLAVCHLIKIDAERMGAEVLMGAARTIARTRPIVFVECDTVTEAAGILGAMDTHGYTTFVVRTAAFDALNPRGNPENFFGFAHESALLFLPEPDATNAPTDLPGVALIPCATLDEVAAALLATPRFGERGMSDKDPAVLRAVAEATGRMEAALAEAQSRAVRLEEEIREIEAEHRDDSARLRFRIASLEWQLAQGEGWWSIPMGSVASLQERIRALETSTSWRITAPIRSARRLLSALRR